MKKDREYYINKIDDLEEANVFAKVFTVGGALFTAFALTPIVGRVLKDQILFELAWKSAGFYTDIIEGLGLLTALSGITSGALKLKINNYKSKLNK